MQNIRRSLEKTMHRVQHQNLTNGEMAQYAYSCGVKNLSREELEHIALRYVALIGAMREAGKDCVLLTDEVTRTPHVIS